ncbi:type I restriction enzyme endonuclease domain-containing protein [Lawsonella clevelandensis]|uniref:type I restriction enzyme endonuclease domain-containing protein n=1 Tax=Lawsonella clevelandensis TaxID=1528099 RepID=UPI0018D90B16|nr:type I restriction enzyme endonuclease domain-containing protein [Lawsonella clevelandensis]
MASRPEAEAIRDDVRLFTDVRAAVLKILNPDAGKGRVGTGNIDSVLAQLVNESVTADQVVDICQFAGMERPELTLLSDEFLDSIGKNGKPNLQIGLLRRLQRPDPYSTTNEPSSHASSPRYPPRPSNATRIVR